MYLAKIEKKITQGMRKWKYHFGPENSKKSLLKHMWIEIDQIIIRPQIRLFSNKIGGRSGQTIFPKNGSHSEFRHGLKLNS